MLDSHNLKSFKSHAVQLKPEEDWKLSVHSENGKLSLTVQQSQHLLTFATSTMILRTQVSC